MSEGRFLTTHVGSLPRGEALRALMFAREDGAVIDEREMAARIDEAIADVVARQATAGIDIVNDGEQSKPSYATYIKDRLTGFGGESGSYVFQDLEDYPGAKSRMTADEGRKHRRAPACTGPIAVKDFDASARDAVTLKDVLVAHPARQGFMSAASPGVTALFFQNGHYARDEDYLFALADALRHEYEAIAAAGLILQIDCPDLAMGRHTQFRELSLGDFRDRLMLNIEALNRATANIAPQQMRIHLCWGNYPGPHTHDVPMRDIVDLVWRARPVGIQFEAANPRHAHEFALFDDIKLPEGKLLIPGVIENQSPYIEHPELVAQRIGRYADRVGRDNVMAGVDCGFSVHVGSDMIDRDVVWAKLKSLSEGAAIASKRYWP